MRLDYAKTWSGERHNSIPMSGGYWDRKRSRLSGWERQWRTCHQRHRCMCPGCDKDPWWRHQVKLAYGCNGVTFKGTKRNMGLRNRRDKIRHRENSQ